MPVVVVLKEGKHLSAREAENERRRARGLSPLPDSDEQDISPAETTTQGSAAPTSAPAAGPSNTKAKSAVQIGGKVGGAKRKVPLGGRDDEQDAGSPANKRIKGASGVGVQKKDKKEKTKKKAVKGLLSFGDDG
ncbi:hypothetical protein M408DRAFT_11448 [Serendipita vermifera MAFF 305830]|uniref:DUF4604 domain-containing protein n=1 Tax=Serendipita vermifera MAFF 305830 TaxID=933852 RepID=A0A0C2X2I8_SERVB|nr:hypothetical protein M408DRAFT_11448 [Serendipita vermifera MAFF 305830]